MIIFFSLFIQISLASVATSTCSTIPLANCLTTGFGYCRVSAAGTACEDVACYKINEVAACRSGGARAATCKETGSFSLQYDNVCMLTADTKMQYYQVRFPISTAGTPTNTLTGVTTTALRAGGSVTVANLYQLYTFNMQTATNTQLLDILDTYIAFDAHLTTDAHPYYMEKAIFQSLQNLRDDETITKPGSISATLTKVWGSTASVSFSYFKRLRTFSKHYQTNYYFVNFAQTTLSRLYLTMNGQLHTTTISWTQYTANGYIQVLSYPAKQFGALATALSDVVMISFITTDGTGTVSMLPKLTYICTDSTWTQPTKLYIIAAANRNNLSTSTDTGLVLTCDPTNKRCEATLLTAITSGIYYFGT